jgi:hypothetical protein
MGHPAYTQGYHCQEIHFLRDNFIAGANVC